MGEDKAQGFEQMQRAQEWFENVGKLTANHHGLFLAVFELLEKDCGVPRSRIIETIEIMSQKLDEKGYGGSTAQNLLDIYKNNQPDEK